MSKICELNPIYRGNVKRLNVVVEDQSTGDPVDITGDTVILTVKEQPDSDTPVYSSSKTTHDDPTNGLTKFEIPSATTKNFKIKSYYLDVTWLDASEGGEPLTILYASMDVEEPIRDPV